MHLPRPVIFLFCQAVLGQCVLAQTGTLVNIQRNHRASVMWDSAVPPPNPGSLGSVVEGDRLVAVFRTLTSENHSSMVQILDVILPSLLTGNQAVHVLDVDPSPRPPGQASMIVWSDRLGGSFQIDGKPAGKVPARIILEPGSHEFRLELPEGEWAGAKVEARPDQEDVICLHGRGTFPTQNLGPPLFLPFVPRSLKESGEAQSLRWLEDRQGLRVYACDGPVKNPVVKKKVAPRYPKSARSAYEQGRVGLEVLLAIDGRIQQVDVVTSTAPALSQAATKAVRQWTYEPATLDGKPVPVFFTVFIDFMLKY